VLALDFARADTSVAWPPDDDSFQQVHSEALGILIGLLWLDPPSHSTVLVEGDAMTPLCLAHKFSKPSSAGIHPIMLHLAVFLLQHDIDIQCRWWPSAFMVVTDVASRPDIHQHDESAAHTAIGSIFASRCEWPMAHEPANHIPDPVTFERTRASISRAADLQAAHQRTSTIIVPSSMDDLIMNMRAEAALPIPPLCSISLASEPELTHLLASICRPPPSISAASRCLLKTAEFLRARRSGRAP
jgi:hypothetical protein